MGYIYTDITLENPGDVAKAYDGFIKESDIRRVTLKALVDTGANTLVISEDIRKKLGLRVLAAGHSRLAGNGRVSSSYADPVSILWKDRFTSCYPIVLENQEPVLLGSLALEGMDLIPDPLHETIVGRHGSKPLTMIM
jgi:clan AA aspartic protease